MSNYIKRVAIVGATGRVGGAFAAALVKTGKHQVTALTRGGSQASLPEGVTAVEVDYDKEETVVSALKDQQFLIVTLGVRAPPETHSKILQAAGKAGVPHIMPNHYGYDMYNEALSADDVHNAIGKTRNEEIQSLGATYTPLVCGFWYEWSLAIGEQWYGFDLRKKTVTFFDDGNTKINSSTWNQCGRAIAALLSLPKDGASPSFSDWMNKPLYIDSFLVSQREMLDSIHRVAGSADKDWTIKYESTEKRVADGRRELAEGIFVGRAKVMYSRVFYPNGDGNFGATRELANNVLGLPKESLDEATKRTIDMVEAGFNPFNL